jgi:hypothetical protein
VNLFLSRDYARQALAQGKSVLRQFDGRLQNLRKAHRAPPAQQGVPGVHHSGQAAGEQTIALGQLAPIIFLVPLDGSEFGSARPGVHGINCFLRSAVQQYDRITAHAIHGEIRHGECGLTGHGSVECISPGLQDAASGFRRFRFHGRNCSLASANDGTHCLPLRPTVLDEPVGHKRYAHRRQVHCECFKNNDQMNLIPAEHGVL